MSSSGYYLYPASITTVPSKLSQAPPVTVPCTAPHVQGGGKAGFNEFGIWVPQTPDSVDCSQPGAPAQTGSGSTAKNPPEIGAG